MIETDTAIGEIDASLITLKEDKLTVRLDKWLWAVRFFKTRPLARLAIENGEVKYNDAYVKPNLEIQIGDTVKVRQRGVERTVMIKGLSTRRRSTEETIPLFEEIASQEITERPRTRNRWRTHSSFDKSQFSQQRRTVRFLRRGNNKADSVSPDLFLDQTEDAIPFESHS